MLTMAEKPKKLKLTASETDAGQRLDRWLSVAQPDYSRAYLQKLIKTGKVAVNGKVVTVPRTPVPCPAEISVEIPPEPKRELSAESIGLDIIHEDDAFLVINKPPGLVVHPAAGNWSGTLVNALLGHDADFAGQFPEDESRPGIVHRLDKDTSGCLVVAKNPSSHFKLARLFAARKVKKTYAAIVLGRPKKATEEIRTLIGRHPVNRKKMAVVDRNGREAITIYRLVKSFEIGGIPVSLLEVDILTGRTHQIRVHLAHKQLPVLGDSVYGGHQAITVPRQLLHAWKLEFPHPESGKKLSFTAPFPTDFHALLSDQPTS